MSNQLLSDPRTVKVNSGRHRLYAELLNRMAGEPESIIQVFERTLDGIWYWDIEDTDHEWMSPKFWTTFGFDPAEKQHIVREWQELIFPEDLTAATENLTRHLADPLNPSCRFDQLVRYRTQGGDVRIIHCTGQALLNASGKPYRMLGMHTDLTEQLKYEEDALKAAEFERLRGLANFLTQLTWTCTPEGICDFISETWADYVGSTPENLVGLGWLQYVHPEDQKDLEAWWQHSVQTGEDLRCQFRIRARDGSYRLFDTRARAMRDADGRIQQWFGSNTDIQESTDYQQRLKITNEQLEQKVRVRTQELEEARASAEAARSAAESERRKAELASQAKSRFLSTVSHELRTPLNGISGLAYSLERCPDRESQKTYLKQLRLAVQHLNEMVSDVLDMNKIEAGLLELNSETCNLREVCESALAMVAEAASNKNLEVRFYFSNSVPSWAISDPLRIKQILVNFLNNAIKFTAAGFIKLSCHLDVDDGPGLRIRFEVEDSGIGIEEKYLVTIFNMFEQGARETFVHYGGSGFGLALVKNLAELMGGRVSVQSRFGEGSTFAVTLPIRRTEEPNQPLADGHSAAPLCLSNLTALVVDDMDLNLLVIRNILELNGVTVHTAKNGRQALETLQALAGINVIFMDIHMPELDGLAATRRIRQLDSPLAGIPILALTGAAMTEDVQLAMNAGVNRVLFKPVDPDKLLTELNAVLLESTTAS